MTYTEEPSTASEPSTAPEVKLIDRISNYRKEHGKPFFSLEFFPPRNETELDSFWPLMNQLRQGGPLFMDITWHARTNLDPDNKMSSLGIASTTIERFNHETILHLTCSEYDEPTMESILNSAKSHGIKNILALRGDPPVPLNKGEEEKQNSDNHEQSIVTNEPSQSNGTVPDDLSNESFGRNGFSCALDLVKFIRTKFGDHFTVGVAGYPMGHPDAKSYSDDLNYLKSKVDAGADFIVTQLSFSADHYITFIKDCRTLGIKVPIVPGIFPIQTIVSIRNITKLTQIEPPEEMKKAINDCKGDVEAIRQYGLKYAIDLCTKLINSDLDIPGLHFYTLNRDLCVTETLKQLDLWNVRSDQIESQKTDLHIVLPAAYEPDLPKESIVC